MKAEDYITKWCADTYGGGKELGDWTTAEVMKFANDFASEVLSWPVVKTKKLFKCTCENPDVAEIKMCLECTGIYHNK